MTRTRNTGVEPQDERGSAAVAVLLLLMMMSALAAALNMSGQTETLISRNQWSATQAQAAAEAGLSHAVELATTYIFEWKANGFADADAAIDALLSGPDLASGSAAADADNGSLGARPGIDAAEAIPLGAQLDIADGIDATYEAFIMDDDATAPNEPTGDPYDDENEVLIVRATGYGQGSTKVVLEALIGPIALPAVVVAGDLTISDNVAIGGSDGSVHANGDLLINGGMVTVAGAATASGTYTGSPAGGGGAPQLPVPEIRSIDYWAHADFVLTSLGTVVQPDGTVMCDASGEPTTCAESYGWAFYGAAGWDSWGEAATNRTFYVETAVAIGDVGGTPDQITVISQDSILVSSSADITPNTDNLLFVTDGDLRISSDMATGAPGQILVHGQIDLGGNPSIIGQIIVENAAGAGTSVTDNDIRNGVTITYNGGLGGDTFNVRGWRDVRDDD